MFDPAFKLFISVITITFKVTFQIIHFLIQLINKPPKPEENPDNTPEMHPTHELLGDGASGFIFGEGASKSEYEDGHVMIVGGVGSGKSSCLAIPTLLNWGERIFAIDIKGELYTKTKHSKNRNIKAFNPLDPNTIGYDPFYLLKQTADHVQEAQAIAHALVPLSPNMDEPFWVQSAQSLFSGAILHFFNEGYSFIETITAILDSQPKALVEEIFTSENADSRRFVASFMTMKETTLSSVFTTLSNQIMIFATNPNIKNSLNKAKNITPNDLENGFDIYIRIPENLLKQWKNLLTLMVAQFITHFEQRPDSIAQPILFLLDEFARLGKIEGITDGLATLRSKKITIAIILQSLAQLDLIYGKSTRQVIADTCQFKAVLNVTDVESQEYFSKAVGTFEKIRTTKTQQYTPHMGFNGGQSITTSYEEKPLIIPHKFATLDEIVLLTPYGAFKVEKTPYYEDEEYLTMEATKVKAVREKVEAKNYVKKRGGMTLEQANKLRELIREKAKSS